MILTYRYRLLPSKRQHRALADICEAQRVLYNAALAERIDCYRKTGKTRTYVDQCKALTQCRRDLPEMAAVPANIQRGTLKRLDAAFAGFFSRLKTKAKAGFPRFKGKGWWSSFEFREFSGIRFDRKRLRFAGCPGGVRVHLHRSMPSGKILGAKFKRDHKGWSVCFSVHAQESQKRVVTQAVGVDVGIKTLAACSDGLMIPNPRPARRAEREMRRRQRQLARCKRGSARRKKVRQTAERLHVKIANTRTTALHQASALLVRQYDLIAVEALNVKGLASGMLARDVNDAGWGRLLQFVRYKAARAGVHFIEVDPSYTSQTCPECGIIKRKELSERTHACECGCILDRDVAAARVILHRAVVRPGERKTTGYRTSAPGNLKLKGMSN